MILYIVTESCLTYYKRTYDNSRVSIAKTRLIIDERKDKLC